MRHAVVVALDRQPRLADAERLEQRVRIGVRLDGRHRLGHTPEHDAAGFVAVELHRNDSHAGLELDDATLERLREHPRRTENGMSCEAHLFGRIEDPDARRATLLGRQQERRLREVHLPRERLHQVRVDLTRVREHRELIAGECRVGEDVDDDVAQGRHAATLPSVGIAHIVSGRAAGDRRL